MFEGKITLKDVEFCYSKKPVLKNIMLEINPHETVAIVGPNGAGKSTIISLILGFYLPLKGQLYADDYSFSTLDIVHLRCQIGVVMQEAGLCCKNRGR
jgi:ABC-type bacteriocin/lantibiotic exporter with double-glycine peptidase domain